MTRPTLRLFAGPDREPKTAPTRELRSRVRLGHIVETLKHAVTHDRAWLADFADEEVAVSEDLLEILEAYQKLTESPNQAKSA